MTAGTEGGGTQNRPPEQHNQQNVLLRKPVNCRHLGRVAASPDPGTTRGRRPEAPDGVAPVGAISPTGKPETWDGWDSVDRPAVGTMNTHPLTATFPGCARALGGSAESSQLSPLQGKVTTRRFRFGDGNLPRPARAHARPVVALVGVGGR